MRKEELIGTIILFNVFFIAFVSAIIIYMRNYQIKKKQHNAMLQIQHEEHQKELLSTQIEIQRQTMQHIGREIHDNVGQKLTLASLYTQQLAFENKAPQINEAIDNISSIINQSLSELRELSKSLTDDTIEANSIHQLISLEVKKLKELQLCSVSFENNKPELELPYHQKSIVFRILQEFIQNSIKHAHCDAITIELMTNSNSVQLVIKDNGKGFDTQMNSTGIGLVNMKKRAELIGGTFHLMSEHNTGTQLTVSLPL
ncbi:MAG: sensor histidine kinase [Flavobacteriales bacterium]|nr:sensor histidine kinase [Flavobacteriales bacterium]